MKNKIGKNDRRSYMRSSSFKMALLFALLLSLSTGVLGYFSYYFTQGRFVAAAETLIETEDAYLSLANAQGVLPATLAAAARWPGRVYLLWDAGGRGLGGNLTALPKVEATLAEGTVLFHLRGRLYAAEIVTFADGQRLLTGVDVTDSARSYRLLQWLSLLSIAFMALVVLAAFVISTFVVSRTNRIAETAQRIMQTGDLSQRIAIDSRWDDLSNLAFVLNALLSRIEALLEGIRTVSDNIAHDLRTPLTRLLNNLEALRGRDSVVHDAAAHAHCETMIAETTQLLETFNALLRIGAVEAGSQREHFARADMRKIVADVAELYEPLAEQRSIALRTDLSEVPAVSGDANLLFQAVVNLLDNAIKFTPDGGRISVKLRAEDGVILTVADNGPGIGAPDRAKVFDRFYRTEQSRTTAGNGLGLSLVAAVVALHEGRIALDDAAPGLLITLTLPNIKTL